MKYMKIINYVSDGDVWFFECKSCSNRIYIRMPYSCTREDFLVQVSANGWINGQCPKCQNKPIEVDWGYKKPYHTAEYDYFKFQIRTKSNGERELKVICPDGSIHRFYRDSVQQAKKLAVEIIKEGRCD